MADLGGFDASKVAPNDFGVLPAGEYEACVVGSEQKLTKDGSGKYLNLKIQILNGEYQNRIVFDKLNLWSQSDKAMQIAKGQLSALCRAVGVLTPKDSSDLHNKPFRMKLKVRKSEEYGDQNQVSGYYARHAVPAGQVPIDPVQKDTSEMQKAPW